MEEMGKNMENLSVEEKTDFLWNRMSVVMGGIFMLNIFRLERCGKRVKNDREKRRE